MQPGRNALWEPITRWFEQRMIRQKKKPLFSLRTSVQGTHTTTKAACQTLTPSSFPPLSNPPLPSSNPFLVSFPSFLNWTDSLRPRCYCTVQNGKRTAIFYPFLQITERDFFCRVPSFLRQYAVSVFPFGVPLSLLLGLFLLRRC